MRADGTNASVLQSCKAHVCEVVSFFKHSRLAQLIDGHLRNRNDETPMAGDDGTEDDDRNHDIVAPLPEGLNRIYPDILKIPLSCGGAECRAMLLRQTGSVGVRPWTDEEDAMQTAHARSVVFALTIWNVGSNSGPDQQGADRLINEDISGMPLVWAIRQWRQLHYIHLVAPLSK